MAGTMITKKLLVGGLAAAAIAASFIHLFHKPTEKDEQLATSASEALGMRAADEVAQLLGNKGRVAILELELRPGQAVTAVASVQKFRETLKKHGISVERSKSIAGGLTKLVMGGGMTGSDYTTLVEGSPSVDAVVTFAGLPGMPPDELRHYQANHPPFVVVDIFGVLKGPTLPEFVEDKTVAIAFVPLLADEAAKKANEPKMFDRYYRILRAGAK